MNPILEAKIEASLRQGVPYLERGIITSKSWVASDYGDPYIPNRRSRRESFEGSYARIFVDKVHIYFQGLRNIRI